LAFDGLEELLTLNNVVANQLLGAFDRVSSNVSVSEVSRLGGQGDCGFGRDVSTKTMNFVS
jgi:hypothetical protein